MMKDTGDAFNGIIKTYFIFLFMLLFWIYFPTFFHPPRSDSWSAFYNFYRIDALAGACKWKYLVMYDPLINTTFRPLSFLILYLDHHIFGSNYIYSHIFNFGFYFISIVLLYKLAVYFCKDKILIVLFLTIFACLFSHFDIVAWTFHFHIILSFCLFLWGFLLYIHYLKFTRKSYLFLIVVIFLLAMLLYETYLLWPLAIIILANLDEFNKSSFKKNIDHRKSYLVIIGCTYFVYFCLFLLNSFIRASYGPGVSLRFLFSLSSIFRDIFVVFSNILFNNFLMNLLPFLAFPLKIDENLNLGGFINKSVNMDQIILLAGGMTIIILLCAMLYLYKRKRFDIIKVTIFFIFLLISELFVLFHVKSLVNQYPYNFTQFRFQYVPNALCMLIMLFFFDSFLKRFKTKKRIVFTVLFFILLFNILATCRGVSLLNNQLAPLQKMLFNIKEGFRDGRINKDNKLFLDDSLALQFPLLCWNKEMGKRCMRGTYQWVFSKQEIEYFSPYEGAIWIINGKKLNVVRK